MEEAKMCSSQWLSKQTVKIVPGVRRSFTEYVTESSGTVELYRGYMIPSMVFQSLIMEFVNYFSMSYVARIML